MSHFVIKYENVTKEKLTVNLFGDIPLGVKVSNVSGGLYSRLIDLLNSKSFTVDKINTNNSNQIINMPYEFTIPPKSEIIFNIYLKK